MKPYAAAVLLSTFSLLVILLNIPTLWWHIRCRNTGAASVIIWISLMCFFVFINAIIWPNDDFEGRYEGEGLCDVEVKLQVASQVAIPASFACVLRALASIMHTDRLTVGRTDREKRKDLAIDLLWCVGFPMLQCVLHYIVQPSRYIVFGISGCIPTVSNDWLTVLLILVPPVIWTLICTIYAVLIIYRLYRYRRSFSTILVNNGSNKSRFLRLLILCIIWIIASVPVQCYVFIFSLSYSPEAYSWSEVHNNEQWQLILTIPSQGNIVYDRFIWPACGFVMFLFFGFGKEAVKMYMAVFKVLGITSHCFRSDKGSRVKQSTTGIHESQRCMIGNRASAQSRTDAESSLATIDLEFEHQHVRLEAIRTR